MRRSARRIFSVLASAALALIPALFSVTAALAVAGLSALIAYLKWGRSHTGWFRASAYVVAAILLTTVWWRVGPLPGSRPASCQDLRSSVLSAVTARVP